MSRVHYPLFLAVMIAASCVSVAAPRPLSDIVSPIIQEDISSSGVEAGAEVEPASLDDRFIEIEKKQEVILGQQEIITKRLDAIIDHVEGTDDGNL